MLIVGCGHVGTLLARTLGTSRVAGLVRSTDSARRLEAAGIAPRVLDLDRPLPDPLPDARRIWYLAPPPKRGVEETRMKHFLQALARDGRPRRLVYLGTTGVYGDCHGEWVDEHRPIAPRAERALRRADAETRLQAWREEGGGELVLLRVAGIYGPGKLPLARLKAGRPMIAPEQAPWTNRIHVDDLVQVLVAAMERGCDGAIYNVSDGHPGNMADYFNAVADAAGLPRPPVIDPAEAEGKLSAGLRAYLAESRRIDNRRMLRELGVELRYPTLEAGLAACF
ncbi:MAG TPA: SDR family oxidoreductase [Thiolapillus brandeum]|uniref:SDR family oxidoreductase n=1 Tax=Thiolapillus brandeum TaxID=1076588 RepID=A0A7C5IZ93_9GAMM|nr:SDR family oxidoreductase [Thiolapillus brandeum]